MAGSKSDVSQSWLDIWPKIKCRYWLLLLKWPETNDMCALPCVRKGCSSCLRGVSVRKTEKHKTTRHGSSIHAENEPKKNFFINCNGKCTWDVETSWVFEWCHDTAAPLCGSNREQKNKEIREKRNQKQYNCWTEEIKSKYSQTR